MAGNSNEVEQVVARTLRDSLAKLQQTTGELDQAVSDLVSACASSRPSNSLPPMLRARSAAASLAASLEVLSKFVMSALQSSAPAETELLATVPRAAAPASQRDAPATEPGAAFEPALSAQTSPADSQVVESPRLEPTAPSESARPEPAVPVTADSVAPVSGPQFVEPVGASQAVEGAAENVERVESSAPPLPEIVPPPPVSLGPVDFTIAAEPTANEPVVAGEPVAEAAAQTAELYELATWKEPPAVAEADASASAVEVEPPAPLPSAAEIAQFEETKPAPALADVNADVPTSLMASTLSEELPPEAKDFNVLALAPDQQELHRRANRVAKVSMQDVKMLRPRDVALGKEHNDICTRLRDDIEKAHKEYDRRFHAILDHPVDYFYDWMVEILGDGDPKALGEYPYPSPVLRR